MRSRRASAEHSEAVSRRLAQLSAELDAARTEPQHEPQQVAPAAGGVWWSEHTHIADPRPRLSVVAPVALPEREPPGSPRPGPATPREPPTLPTPGRHAARRPRALLGGSVPDTLRGRVTLGPSQLAVVAALVAVGLAVTAWWVVRGDSTTQPPPTVAEQPTGDLVPLPTEPVAPAAPSGVAESTGAVGGTVTVDVAGKVRRPGIAVLDAGARVIDAIEASGGVRPGVDLSSVNLARQLVDGEQILVGETAAAVPGAPSGSVTPPAGSAPAALVNLNLASQTELETLPEVGPVTAQAIIAWRDQNGGYTAVDELLEVDGIGDATLAQIAPFVTV